MTLMICDLYLHKYTYSHACTNPLHIRLKGPYNFRQILKFFLESFNLIKVYFTKTMYFEIVPDYFDVEAMKHRLVTQGGRQ